MAWQFLPPHIDLEAASIAFGIPAKTTFMKSSIATVATSTMAATTTIRLTLGRRVFQLEFRPNLLIDLPAPLSNIGLGGIEYDLTSGVISPRLWYESGVGIPVGRDTAEEKARGFMRDLVTGTPLAVPPYDASEDRDLILTVQQILRNLDSGGSSSVQDISLSATLAILAPIAGDAAGGGFRIPAGSKVQIEVDLEGGPKEVQASPKIRKAAVDCSSLVLCKDGADQCELGRVVLLPGGSLKVEQVRALGDVAKAAAGESLIRLFGAVASGGGIDPRRLAPQIIEGLLKKEVEAALKPALLQWVRDNATLAAGMDLRSVLGIAA